MTPAAPPASRIPAKKPRPVALRVLTRPPGDVSLMQLRYCSLKACACLSVGGLLSGFAIALSAAANESRRATGFS